MASAISLNPSTIILGTDGNWVTYSISIGTPFKAYSLLPSTVLSDTWAISDASCSGYSGNDLTNCENQRGTTFNPSSSNSWEYLFNASNVGFSLGVEGSYGWHTGDIGVFGYDTLGLPSSKGLVPVQNTLVGSVTTNSTTTGLLGLALNQVTLAHDGTTINSNSTLQVLYDAGTIPSRSYSYSAGAFYNGTGGLLILGGYDANSFVPNNVDFTFASDPANILSVGLLSASANIGGTTTSLSDTTEQALIDSTVAELWLPASWCQKFADAFNLTYSPNNQLYTITSDQIGINNAKNPTVSIVIANTQSSSGPSVTIDFPWAAFHANYTNIADLAYSTPYFLLRNTTSSQQPTLGRAFLQEAVLTVDHERRNFSVSQVKNLNTGSQQLVNIYTTSSGGTPTPTTVADSSGGGGGIGGGAIAGIVIAVIVVAAAVAGFFFWRRRRQNKYNSPENARADGPLNIPPGAPGGAGEKSAAAALPTPMSQNAQDRVNDYHAQQFNHTKVMSNDTSELEGNAFSDRSMSPAPHYTPNPVPRDLLAELPENRGRSELHTPAASPEVQSPGISELGSSPEETGEDGMTWDTMPDSETQHGTGRVAYSPGRGSAQIRDLRPNRNGTSSPGIGSSRGNDISMSATSGPLSQELGSLNRSGPGSLKKK